MQQVIEKQRVENVQGTARLILWFLTLLMCIRISSYFSFVPESVELTRIIKVGLRLSMTAITIFCLQIFTSRKPQFRFRFNMLLPFLFYVAYLSLGLLSIYWTTNVSFSLLQLSMTVETLVFSFFFFRLIRLYDLVYEREISSFVFIISRSIFFLSIVFLLGSQFDPDLFYRETHGGTVKRLGGLIINPNELGLLSVVGATLAYIELYFRKNKVFNCLSLISCTSVLLMSQSRSSLFAFLLISGIFLLLSKNVYLKIGAVVVAFLTLPLVINTIVFKDGDKEEVMNLTGRTEFWGDLITDVFPQSPVYGHGFMSINTNTFYNKYESTHAYAASMAHNTYLEVLINLGLIGVFIVLLQMGLTFFAIFSSKEKILRMLAFFMLIPLLINSVTEFGIFGHTNYAIMFYQFIFLFFTISIVRKSDRKKLNTIE